MFYTDNNYLKSIGEGYHNWLSSQMLCNKAQYTYVDIHVVSFGTVCVYLNLVINTDTLKESPDTYRVESPDTYRVR